MKKILIIDDEKRITEAFEALCSSAYEVKSAHTGEAGLKMIVSFKPDMVILDWRLNSRVEGRDVLINLKDNHREITVFVVTASVHSMEEIQTLDPTEIFVKPCIDLRDKIDRFFSG